MKWCSEKLFTVIECLLQSLSYTCRVMYYILFCSWCNVLVEDGIRGMIFRNTVLSVLCAKKWNPVLRNFTGLTNTMIIPYCEKYGILLSTHCPPLKKYRQYRQTRKINYDKNTHIICPYTSARFARLGRSAGRDESHDQNKYFSLSPRNQ